MAARTTGHQVKVDLPPPQPRRSIFFSVKCSFAATQIPIPPPRKFSFPTGFLQTTNNDCVLGSQLGAGMQLGVCLMESNGEEASCNHQATAGKWQGWKELWKQHPRCRDHGGARTMAVQGPQRRGAPPARARSPRVCTPPPRPCPADTSPPCCKDSPVLTSCPLSELLACISNCSYTTYSCLVRIKSNVYQHLLWVCLTGMYAILLRSSPTVPTLLGDSGVQRGHTLDQGHTA